MSRNSEEGGKQGELCDPQLGAPRALRYGRMVGGRQGTQKPWLLWHACAHTALSRSRQGLTRPGRPVQRSWEGRKKQKDRTGRLRREARKVTRRAAFRGHHTWKRRERCVLSTNTPARSRERTSAGCSWCKSSRATYNRKTLDTWCLELCDLGCVCVCAHAGSYRKKACPPAVLDPTEGSSVTPQGYTNALGAWPCETRDRQLLHKAEKPTAPVP